MMVLPFLASFLSNFTMDKALKESRPEVGSSRRINEGSVISSTPIETLFLSPPDKVLWKVPPIGVLATLLRPKSFISYSTLSSYSY